MFQSPSETTIYRTAIKPSRDYSNFSSKGDNLNLNSSDETIAEIPEGIRSLDGENQIHRESIVDEFLSSEKRRSGDKDRRPA